MTESTIDLERVIHDPIYRRQIIERLNRTDPDSHEPARHGEGGTRKSTSGSTNQPNQSA